VSRRREQDGTAGIDAGATLWKLASRREDGDLELLPAGQIEGVRRWLDGRRPNRLHVTGGGASQVAAGVGGCGIREVSEFEAWGRGAPLLARRAGWTLPERYLLVSLGTGTSILVVEGPVVRRAAGSSLGGGTLLGLGRLLCRAESFAELTRLAAHGERGRVDLRVGDVYPQGGIGLPPEATAASFGKLTSREPADLAQGLMALIGENVGALCVSVAQAMAVDTIVFGGGTITGNPTLSEILRQTVASEGREAWFLPDGGFCGAVGAALSGEISA